MNDDIIKTKEDVFRRAVHISHSESQTAGKKNDYYITLAQLERILEKSCPGECHFTVPYGFVPEAGCPVHDVADKDQSK